MLSGDHAAAQERARFVDVAKLAAGLRHPHIVQVYEMGQREGRLHFAMEYVDGGSLDSRVRSAPLPPRAAAQLVERLAQAAHEAHRRGVVHRDLKPGNVLLAPSDAPAAVDLGAAGTGPDRFEPKITDFGM